MRRPFVAFGLAAGLYILITIALTWPLVLHAGSRVPNDLGDSLLNMFLMAWNARVAPLTERWWNLPQFFPIEGAMAFSEHLLGLSVITTPVIAITGNAVLAYNAAFLLSFPLCALGAHALGYELTRRHDAALIAGLAYGFAPYRMSQLSHIQVLSAYWIPLALLALHLFARRPQWRWAALFAVSWYMQALACGYYLFYFSVLVGMWLLWFAIGRIKWRDLARLAIAWGVAGLAFAPIALGYMRYQRTYGFHRGHEEIESFSADIASILQAPGNLRLWGWLTVVDRPESALFPGAVLILVVAAGVVFAWSDAAHESIKRLRAPRILLGLAVLFAAVAATPAVFGPWKIDVFGLRLLSVGTPQKPLSIALLLATIALAMHPSIRAGWRRRSPLAFYSIGAVVMWLMCLGPAPTLMKQPLLYKAPYSWLMMLPGVDGVRVPARFWVLATMCLAIAVGLACLHVIRRRPSLGSSLPAVLASLLLIESWPQPVGVHVPPEERPGRARAVARLEVPITNMSDLITLYRAIGHRKPVVNGYSGYFAQHYAAMQALLERHEPMVLSYLTSLGALEVVVNEDENQAARWRAYFAAYPGAEIAYRSDSYTTYRLPPNPERYSLPTLQGQPLQISAITASLYQDLVGRMIDGDRISRWHTGGPQDPTNEVLVDLGASRKVTGVEMQIGGYVADFPRELIIDLSEDGATWRTGWSGSPGFLALLATIEQPLVGPLRFPLDGTAARFIRMRQTGETRIYYWSIAELRVLGN